MRHVLLLEEAPPLGRSLLGSSVCHILTHTPNTGSRTRPTEHGLPVGDGTSLVGGALGVVSGEEGVGVTAVGFEVVVTGVVGAAGGSDEASSGGSGGGPDDGIGTGTINVIFVGIGEKGDEICESGISTVFTFGNVLVVTTVAPTTTAATPRNVSGDRVITETACPQRNAYWPGPAALRPG